MKRFRLKNLEPPVQTTWDQHEKDLSGQLLCVHPALLHLLGELHLFSLGEPTPTPRPWLHVASGRPVTQAKCIRSLSRIQILSSVTKMGDGGGGCMLRCLRSYLTALCPLKSTFSDLLTAL